MEWPWKEFPEDHSTWETCVGEHKVALKNLKKTQEILEITRQQVTIWKNKYENLYAKTVTDRLMED